VNPDFPNKIFVAGIGTGVGKTVVSAILTEALQADYWKPIQTGTVVSTDKQMVEMLVSNSKTKVFENSLEFLHPYSPHYAAMLENRAIELSGFVVPPTDNRLIMEGAGGLLVPLSSTHLMIDLIKQLGVAVVLVTKHYLGSINHTLLSIEILKQREIPLAGIVFNGDKFADNEEIITHFANAPVIGRIEYAEDIDKDFVKQEADRMRTSISQHYIL
jgi:dethiobiotin synthetase